MVYGLQLLKIARPQFLLASLMLYIIGVSWAMLLGAPFDLARMGLGYLIIASAQLSVSYSNDSFDVGVDRWGMRSLFSGGSGVLVTNPRLRQPALGVAIGLTTISLALALVFSLRYTFPITFLVFVGVCNLLSWLYSLPPARLVYRGLGEVVLALFSGCLLPGTGFWVASGGLESQALAFSVPLSLYGLAFTLAVALPDLESDRQGGKMTWIARLGRRFGFTANGIFFLAASLYFFCALWLFSFPTGLNVQLLAWLSLLPLAVGIVGIALHPEDRTSATRLANLTIGAVAAFLMLMDGVLISAVAR